MGGFVIRSRASTGLTTTTTDIVVVKSYVATGFCNNNNRHRRAHPLHHEGPAEVRGNAVLANFIRRDGVNPQGAVNNTTWWSPVRQTSDIYIYSHLFTLIYINSIRLTVALFPCQSYIQAQASACQYSDFTFIYICVYYYYYYYINVLCLCHVSVCCMYVLLYLYVLFLLCLVCLLMHAKSLVYVRCIS